MGRSNKIRPVKYRSKAQKRSDDKDDRVLVWGGFGYYIFMIVLFCLL